MGNEHLTKECIDFIDASINPNELSKTNYPLFNEEEETERQYANALRELRSQTDPESIKIKRKIIPDLLEKIPDENSFEKIIVRPNVLDYTDFNLHTSG